ncbi:endocuticle structural glycoprotein ABD-5-like [Culex pipiens pallens]|uniref:endocuticle structural glycoprotein ABD-5-like n=1 Tax=Culex pipiens pallens TaxID=42434 RepID=UPI00195324B5|nr:endocuticle structural glycoprotein ABD-5-like [Culex pipiens pallens]
MNKFVVFASVCCVLLAGKMVLTAPQGNPDAAVAPRSAAQDVQTVRYYSENNGLDGYKFTYELSDGQIRSEVGTYRDTKDAEGNIVKTLFVQGSYSFVGPDGQTYWVNYTADENGYHPKVGTGPTGGIQAGQDAPIEGSA